MFELFCKKFVHGFVVASVIFGCSVQAATPSFKEDLDDFEEMHYVVEDGITALEVQPLVILWQNEDLAQSIICSYGVSDDLEQYSACISQKQFVLISQHFLRSSLKSGISTHPIGLQQARAPPRLAN
jgi:hypothetical protein